MDDRTVHAGCKDYEVVRYDRSGRWYLEPRAGDVVRTAINVREAAEHARAALKRRDGFVIPGLHGGTAFDRLVC